MKKDGDHTYYVLIENRPAEVRKSMPDVHHVPVDTFVICEYSDGSINLFRSQFHMGRGGQSPWALEDVKDPTLPGYVKAYLLLIGV